MSTKVSYVKYVSRLIDLKQYIIEQLPNYTLLNLIKNTTKTKTLLNSEISLEFNGVLDYSDIEIINTSLSNYTNPVTPIITKIDSKNINSIKINSKIFKQNLIYESSQSNHHKINTQKYMLCFHLRNTKCHNKSLQYELVIHKRTFFHHVLIRIFERVILLMERVLAP